ncbi:hypothetical protein [Elizabethkingia anophelis]|uniref:hypothetical protein n=1 Tax=Elizabethkingia anophelis TaxID=1117645 RepID=UPI00389182C7
MSSLNSLYIKKETLEQLLSTVTKKNEKGVELTISIQEEGNQYGQNVSAFVSQSKEQRDSGVNKFYVGNGNTFWTDGKIQVVKKNSSTGTGSDDSDLPF